MSSEDKDTDKAPESQEKAEKSAQGEEKKSAGDNKPSSEGIIDKANRIAKENKKKKEEKKKRSPKLDTKKKKDGTDQTQEKDFGLSGETEELNVEESMKKESGITFGRGRGKNVVNPNEFVSKSSNWPVIHGVHYKNGYAIASDSYIMIVNHCDYPEEYEGKIIHPNGEKIDGKYPDVFRVIPNEAVPFRDGEAVISMFERIPKGTEYVTFGGHYHKGKYIAEIVKLAKVVKNPRLFIDKRGCLILMGDGVIIINMPFTDFHETKWGESEEYPYESICDIEN